MTVFSKNNEFENGASKSNISQAIEAIEAIESN
jgi:hypothetical protein